jgi:phospholipid/cholesterol/gamma-HCH transport system ATP-binding protein
MAEEKDADELEAEAASGVELPPLPPIPHQLQPSDGRHRRAERPAGEWCRDNGVTPPPGSFVPDTATAGKHAADTHEHLPGALYPSEVAS